MLPEHLAGFVHDVLLLLQSQGIEGLVFVTVVRHFMPSLDNRLALLRPVLHDPGRDEESRRNPELVE